MDKISVIIPTYNRGYIIEKSVRSVLKQTYTNIEIIIVDDGSTDNTEEVIKSINDKRIKYIKLLNNRGASYARNKGIKASTGKYISFQDSDDIFYNDKLEKQLDNLKKNKSDLDFCKIVVYDNSKKVFYPNELQEKSILKNDYVTELCNANFISTQAILAKKNIFNKVLFDEKLPRLQDYDLVLRLAGKIKISYTNEPLVDLYIQNNSISVFYENLKKACILMIKKSYDIEYSQNLKLIDTLLNWINIPVFQEYSENLNKKTNEIFTLNETIENMNSYISEIKNNYNKEIENKNNEIKIKNTEIEMRNNEIKTKNDEIEMKNNEIEKIINSKSWKYISILRNVKNVLLKKNISVQI